MGASHETKITDKARKYLGTYCPLLETIELRNVTITGTNRCQKLISVTFFEAFEAFSSLVFIVLRLKSWNMFQFVRLMMMC